MAYTSLIFVAIDALLSTFSLSHARAHDCVFAHVVACVCVCVCGVGGSVCVCGGGNHNVLLFVSEHVLILNRIY